MKKENSPFLKILTTSKKLEELSQTLFNKQTEIVLQEQVSGLSKSEKVALSGLLEQDLTEYWELKKINTYQITKMLYQTALKEYIQQ